MFQYLEIKIPCDFMLTKVNNFLQDTQETQKNCAVSTVYCYYRPQRSWGKVTFLHVSVILFTGGVPGQVHPRQVHPSWQVHPLGRYTPQAGAPLAGTSPGRYPPRQVLSQCLWGSGCSKDQENYD